MNSTEDGKTEVRVHQLVKTLDGAVLSDQDVWHTYTFKDGLVERMDLTERIASFKKAE